MRRDPIPLAPGQESVWDYPRPPRLEATSRRIQVVFAGVVIADSVSALRVLETSHPPSYYVPREDCLADALVADSGSSYCEWKGGASYLAVQVGDRVAARAAWFYPSPAPPYAAIRDHIAFYPGLMDECRVAGERARPQAGGFYGGWVTSDIVGPFKGEAGTAGW